MLLTIATTHRPATDLGYLLHKSPGRAQEFRLSFGTGHVFYPVASDERCQAALLLDIDPVGLVRGKASSDGLLDQYVNDRPYVASSFLSVAIAQVFGTALSGRSKDRPDLAERALPFEVTVAALPCRGGEGFLRRLFEPLGYRVDAARRPLDERFPEWGESPYFDVTLNADVRLKDLLAHLYVLIPVLDDEKHYYVGDAEVEKLLRYGEGWLSAHPERDAIAHRFLKHRKRLAREALARLVDEEEPDPDAVEEAHAVEEAALERRLSLNDERLGTVIATLKGLDATRILDLGCGEGRLLRMLAEEKTFEAISGMDVSYRALEVATERLERLPERLRKKVTVFQGSLTYRDRRLEGYGAAVAVEVIEHLDPHRLGAFARVVFESARPRAVVLTTPNVEYNVRFPSLPAGKLRHRDHRFEWTRGEFEGWSRAAAERSGYAVRFVPVGPVDPEVGSPTQMAVFTRSGA